MHAPRLLIAVTSPLSVMFYKGQLAWLRSQGFEVHFLCAPSAQAREAVEAQGATFHAVEMERSIAPWADLRSLFQIARLLIRLRPAIINTGTPKAGLLVMIAAALVGVRARVYTIHGLRLETFTGIKRRIFMFIERVVCGLATDVLCVSRGLRDRVSELALCPRGKSSVAAGGSVNGIPVERFARERWAEAGRTLRTANGIAADALVIGFVGRFVRDKGMRELAQVWSWIRERHPTAHLLMVGDLEQGDPPDPADYRRLQADERVHWTGFLSEIYHCYAAMDLLLFPSYREGLSITLLEAAAMEVPAVASDIPGCRDAVVSRQTGVLVPVHDVEGLRSAVTHYLSDLTLRRRHGQAARAYLVENFSQPQVWQALSTYYRGVFERRV